MMVLEKVNRQVNEGKRIKHGEKPNRYSFFCLHSLVIKISDEGFRNFVVSPELYEIQLTGTKGQRQVSSYSVDLSNSSVSSSSGILRLSRSSGLTKTLTCLTNLSN
jgi:hypothetical protein